MLKHFRCDLKKFEILGWASVAPSDRLYIYYKINLYSTAFHTHTHTSLRITY